MILTKTWLDHKTLAKTGQNFTHADLLPVTHLHSVFYIHVIPLHESLKIIVSPSTYEKFSCVFYVKHMKIIYVRCITVILQRCLYNSSTVYLCTCFVCCVLCMCFCLFLLTCLCFRSLSFQCCLPHSRTRTFTHRIAFTAARNTLSSTQCVCSFTRQECHLPPPEYNMALVE
jgi:hypothetical protein